jgi:hypothetical protein
MTNGRASRRRALVWLRALLLLVVALGAISVGIVRFYPYPRAFTAFPRVTRTHAGVAGDPINLILIGSQCQITHAFARAGWLIPDPITPQTIARIVAASLAHQAYPTAPVSALYAFGRGQDLAFERPTRDVASRDHIRF